MRHCGSSSDSESRLIKCVTVNYNTLNYYLWRQLRKAVVHTHWQRNAVLTVVLWLLERFQPFHNKSEEWGSIVIGSQASTIATTSSTHVSRYNSHQQKPLFQT